MWASNTLPMKYERSIEIAAPPEKVWEVMADLEGWPSWTASFKSLSLLDPLPIREGLRAKVAVKGGPTGTWTVTECEPGRQFTWKNKAPGVRSTGYHAVEPLGENRSRVTLRAEMEGIGALLLRPMLARVAHRNLEMESEGLKRAAEGGSAPSR